LLVFNYSIFRQKLSCFFFAVALIGITFGSACGPQTEIHDRKKGSGFLFSRCLQQVQEQQTGMNGLSGSRQTRCKG
jgi:hypothetical protein